MEKAESSFASQLLAELRQVWSAATFGLSGIGLWLRNSLRQFRRLRTDYVVIPLSGALPERSGPPRGFWQRRLPLFPDPPLSVDLLNHRLRAVADAGNVKGVVFVLQGLTIGLGTCQSLRRAIQRLRMTGKEIVVFTPYLDLAHYYVASAADRIVVPPASRFELVGLRLESVFLKDALDRLGIQADVLQISPFKTAYNELGEGQMTPEQEQQINWLLDDAFDQITTAIATDRDLDPDELRALIDRAPLSAEAARDAALIDDIAYEDTLPDLLAASPQVQDVPDAQDAQGDEPRQSASKRALPRATLSSWSQARAILLEKRRRPSRKYIGVVSLQGAITMGASRRSPLPIPLVSGPAAGEATLSSLLRRVEKDRRLAALVIQIDSGGGSALASDLIWRQVQRLASRVPVVAYFGNIAASGAYYVAAAAHQIVSQPLTFTGSIGVVTFRVSTRGFFEKIDINRVVLQRGRHAGLDGDLDPLTDEERQVLWQEISDTYRRFIEVVASGRKRDPDSLDDICLGRVWTGRQAQQHGLVDRHGDLLDAIATAADLAKLPIDDDNDVPVYDLYPIGSAHVLPQPFEEPAELLRQLTLDRLTEQAGKPMLVMPVDIRLR